MRQEWGLGVRGGVGRGRSPWGHTPGDPMIMEPLPKRRVLGVTVGPPDAAHPPTFGAWTCDVVICAQTPTLSSSTPPPDPILDHRGI